LLSAQESIFISFSAWGVSLWDNGIFICIRKFPLITKKIKPSSQHLQLSNPIGYVLICSFSFSFSSVAFTHLILYHITMWPSASMLLHLD
jgi:hypothetical protein